MREEILVLILGQIEVRTVDFTDHFLPFVQWRSVRRDIDKLDVLALQFLLHRLHRLMTSTARTAPCCPDVDEHSLALIQVEDGLQDVLWRHIVIFLVEDAIGVLCLHLFGQLVELAFHLLLSFFVVANHRLAVLAFHLAQDLECLRLAFQCVGHSLQVTVVGVLLWRRLVEIDQRTVPEFLAAWRTRLVHVLESILHFLFRESEVLSVGFVEAVDLRIVLHCHLAQFKLHVGELIGKKHPPMHVFSLRCHAEHILRSRGVLGGFHLSHTLLEGVVHKVKTLLWGGALAGTLIIRFLLLLFIVLQLLLHQVHVRLGKETLHGKDGFLTVDGIQQDGRLLSGSDDDVLTHRAHAIHTNHHLACQPHRHLSRHRSVLGNGIHLSESGCLTQRCEVGHEEVQAHLWFVAQHLHLEGCHLLVDLGCRQRLVLGILHVLPVSRQLQLLRLRVADVPESERLLVVTLREVKLLRVQG